MRAVLDQKDAEGYTPLAWAVRVECVPIVEWLLEHGASVNVANAAGQTPLGLACLSAPNLPIIAALLKAGADPNCVDGQVRLQ